MRKTLNLTEVIYWVIKDWKIMQIRSRNFFRLRFSSLVAINELDLKWNETDVDKLITSTLQGIWWLWKFHAEPRSAFNPIKLNSLSWILCKWIFFLCRPKFLLWNFSSSMARREHQLRDVSSFVALSAFESLKHKFKIKNSFFLCCCLCCVGCEGNGNVFYFFLFFGNKLCGCSGK